MTLHKKIENDSGLPRGALEQAADTYAHAKAVMCVYGMGLTQHRRGVQNVQMVSNLLLLRGNIGRPGGGILALRGHASIQGSTDIPTLYDILPGYLSMPKGDGTEETLQGNLDLARTFLPAAAERQENREQRRYPHQAAARDTPAMT